MCGPCGARRWPQTGVAGLLGSVRCVPPLTPALRPFRAAAQRCRTVRPRYTAPTAEPTAPAPPPAGTRPRSASPEGGPRPPLAAGAEPAPGPAPAGAAVRGGGGGGRSPGRRLGRPGDAALSAAADTPRRLLRAAVTSRSP